MPKAKAAASLVGMIDSDDEQTNVDVLGTEDSNQENREPSATAKSKAKPRAPRKTKPASKRLSGGKPKATAARRAARRAPSKTQAKNEEAELSDGADELESSPIAGKKEAPAPTQKVPEKAAPKRKGRPAKKKIAEPTKEEEEPTSTAIQESIQKDGEFEYTPTTVRQAMKGASKAKKPLSKRAKASEEPALPEPLPDAMDVDRSIASIEQDDADAFPLDANGLDLDLDASLSASPPPTPQPARARSSSRQPGPHAIPTSSTNPHKRTASSLDPPNPTNPSEPAQLRRKLGALTTKFSSLETKYAQLRNLGVKEAEENFARLKRTTNDRNKAATDLIASLKRDLATQRAATDDARAQLPALDAANAEIAHLQGKVSEMGVEMGDVVAENKALQARLVASRNAAAGIEAIGGGGGGKAPGSAVKKSGAGVGKTVMVGSAEAVNAARVAALKEELYGDLTGLIVRGVERGEEVEVYDCIQTGRNGSEFFPSSHFPLLIQPIYLCFLGGGLERQVLTACVCGYSAPFQALHFHGSGAVLRRDRVRVQPAARRRQG